MVLSFYSTPTPILNISNSIQVGMEIESIYNVISSIYSNISKAYYNTAKESIIAAEHCKDPAIELRMAKNNLVSAYEMAKNIQNMQIKKKILIIFTTTDKVLQDENYRSYYLNLSILSAYISLLYRKLDEKENEKRWEKETFIQFDIFLHNMELNDNEKKQLFNNSSGYVSYHSETDFMPGADRSADPDIIIHDEYYDLTDLGVKYQEKMKRKLLTEFRRAYRAGFIFLK